PEERRGPDDRRVRACHSIEAQLDHGDLHLCNTFGAAESVPSGLAIFGGLSPPGDRAAPSKLQACSIPGAQETECADALQRLIIQIGRASCRERVEIAVEEVCDTERGRW